MQKSLWGKAELRWIKAERHGCIKGCLLASPLCYSFTKRPGWEHGKFQHLAWKEEIQTSWFLTLFVSNILFGKASDLDIISYWVQTGTVMQGSSRQWALSGPLFVYLLSPLQGSRSFKELVFLQTSEISPKISSNYCCHFPSLSPHCLGSDPTPQALLFALPLLSSDSYLFWSLT